MSQIPILPRPALAPPIASQKVLIKRKIFFLDLKENHRGVLKITEDVGGRRNTIMLPAEGFGDFVAAQERLVEFVEVLQERAKHRYPSLDQAES